MPKALSLHLKSIAIAAGVGFLAAWLLKK